MNDTFKLDNDWGELLAGEMEKPYFKELMIQLQKEYDEMTIYPAKENLFAALHHTSYQQTKVVILGQDPYHGPGQAHGMSFSVLPGVALPPSLRNIYRELEDDLGIAAAEHGYLLPWAKQGVLLLNAVLTVREGSPNSHRGLGWETFTDEVIRLLGQRDQPCVFLLWGANAQAKRKLIDRKREHLILVAPHPSPLSAYRGFFGSKPFSQTNQFLHEQGMEEIEWTLPHN